VVLAMAVTVEVDGGTPMDRGEPRDGGASWPALGCGMVGGRARHARGTGVRCVREVECCRDAR
jgi:hypothetical protein